MKSILKDKKAQTAGLVTGLIMGIGALVIATIVTFVIVDTIDQADLVPLGDTATENQSSLTIDRMIGNLTSGVDGGGGDFSTGYDFYYIMFKNRL